MRKLPKLKIVLTACGCPGASTLIRMLKNNGEREIEIIGTDMREEAIGRFLTDDFYKVPPGRSENYIEAMLSIVEKEKPDILFPESSYEVYPIALNKKKFEGLGTKVLVSEPEPIKTCIDKHLMYETLKGHVELPEYYLPKNIDEFLNYAKKLGYPQKKICFKPPISKGSRGFRIIKDDMDKAELLLKHTHSNKYITMDDFMNIFKKIEPFPQLLLMEFLEGKEYTIDALVKSGKILFSEVKTREDVDTGLAMYFIKRNMPELVEYSQKILSEIPLDYCINIQTKGGKLLEINPRVSTFVYQEDLIPPYLAIKLILEEVTEKKLIALQAKVRDGWKSVRYYDQVFFE